ncbi:hypothetical protein FALBO_10745 [Fusarium albosuccineum]|uniref:Uncharacterized protein n=1 Tax=Fusarium albosuccineum TaxID=1237068 RepID=A0A8H4L3K8_9HYPO|nr:hypothetical protein FALBO_10745 [Fusarium albosuccineum]
MALLAPYNDAMKLGSGFNSFTQELCLDGAVVREDGTPGRQHQHETDDDGDSGKPHSGPVAQLVTYKTSIIDKVSDGFDTLDINAAFTIKNSDLTYMVSCKVVNQITMDQSLTKFSPIQTLKAADFPRVYGDSFISGFQEGGEFNAIISIRAKDRSQAHTIKADASVSLTLEKDSGSLDVGLDKIKSDILTENETTVSVTWTGGGQGLKKSDEDWTFDTMKAAALKFPELVARCPMRTDAVLTKYTSLKSFHAMSTQFNPLSYESARVYTSALRDAFLDYQNISKQLSVLSLDVNSGSQKLVTQKERLDKDFAEKTLKASDPSLLGDIFSDTGAESVEKDIKKKSEEGKDKTDTKEASTVSDNGSEEAIIIDDNKVKDDSNKETNTEADDTKVEEKPGPPSASSPLVIDKPYPPTMYGLEAARMQCRFMMNRIVAEVDKVATHPEIAADESRPLPYMSPFLFNMLLPVGIPVNY